MERVTGIGGTFFRAHDPEALALWYAEHLGFEITDFGGSIFRSDGGEALVWAPFAADTDYFGRSDQQWMLNFRVRDLDAMLAQLRAAGVEVLEHVEDGELGRFGWAVDLEGNRFELWQPPPGQ